MFSGVEPRVAVKPPINLTPNGNTNWASTDAYGRVVTQTVKNGAIFASILAVANQTYYLMGSSPRTGIIVSANAWVDAANCTANVLIAGANVGNLNALALTTTPIANNSISSNIVSVGSSIAVVVTNVGGTANLNITLIIQPT